MSYKGYFKPRNPEKYRGDPTNIIYRSLWELKLMGHLDSHPDVIQWASEEFIIPYRSPIDNRIHRYFPDFYVKRKNKHGIIEVLIIEVKPYKETIPPTPLDKGKKPTKRFLNEVRTYGINSSKWKAAREFCSDRGWNFQIMTEKELGIKF